MKISILILLANFHLINSLRLSFPSSNIARPQAKFNKVNIDVHYETRCPDSVRFINSQISSNLIVKDYVNFNMVPYGIANVNREF
jgi:hypothetical protein